MGLENQFLLFQFALLRNPKFVYTVEFLITYDCHFMTRGHWRFQLLCHAPLVRNIFRFFFNVHVKTPLRIAVGTYLYVVEASHLLYLDRKRKQKGSQKMASTKTNNRTKRTPLFEIYNFAFLTRKYSSTLKVLKMTFVFG